MQHEWDAQCLTSSHHKYFKTMACKCSAVSLSDHPALGSSSPSKQLHKLQSESTEHCEYKLIMVSWSTQKCNSMDSAGSATAKTHHSGLPSGIHAHTSARASPEQVMQPPASLPALAVPRTRGSPSFPQQDPNCGTTHQKAGVG